MDQYFYLKGTSVYIIKNTSVYKGHISIWRPHLYIKESVYKGHICIWRSHLYIWRTHLQKRTHLYIKVKSSYEGYILYIKDTSIYNYKKDTFVYTGMFKSHRSMPKTSSFFFGQPEKLVVFQPWTSRIYCNDIYKTDKKYSNGKKIVFRIKICFSPMVQYVPWMMIKL